MAVDVYMVFVPNSGALPTSESTIDIGSSANAFDPFGVSGLKSQNVFEVLDYSYDVEQTLSLGSGTGSGAGKIMFNPLSITRRVDLYSETLFLNAATGTTLKYVDLILRKSAGSQAAGTFLAYRFGLVAVKTIGTQRDDESPTETVTFEYGTLSMAYSVQRPDGSFNAPVIVGWDRIRNVRI